MRRRVLITIWKDNLNWMKRQSGNITIVPAPWLLCFFILYTGWKVENVQLPLIQYIHDNFLVPLFFVFFFPFILFVSPLSSSFLHHSQRPALWSLDGDRPDHYHSGINTNNAKNFFLCVYVCGFKSVAHIKRQVWKERKKKKE